MYTVPKLEDYSQETLEREGHSLLRTLGAEKELVETEEQFKVFRARWLARKNGIKTQLVELWLKSDPAERKKWAGILVNDLASNIEREVKDRHESLELYELFRGELGTEVAPHISEKA